MLDVDIGTNRKIRRLTPSERWCHIAGVLSVAAKAPIRGRLLIGQQEPELRDYAEQAGVSVAVAKSTMAKLRDLAVVLPDEEHGCEMIHDWSDCNPDPKHDPTAPERMKRYRERRNNRNENGGVTDRNNRNVTPGREEKGREEKLNPPKSPQGDTAGDEKAEAARAFDEWLLDHSSVTGMTPPKAGTKARAAVREAFAARLAEGYTIGELKAATRGAQADEHRRTNGYVGPDSVLRPTKIHGLIENAPRARPVGGRASDLVDLLPGNREDAAA